jgi:hypothetical protein
MIVPNDTTNAQLLNDFALNDLLGNKRYLQ